MTYPHCFYRVIRDQPDKRNTLFLPEILWLFKFPIVLNFYVSNKTGLTSEIASPLQTSGYLLPAKSSSHLHVEF